MTDRWLLDRAMSMLAALLEERDRLSRRLVTLPPEGASLHEIERAAMVAALDGPAGCRRRRHGCWG